MGGAQSRRGVGRWGQWQLSSAETSIDWRSARPVVLDIPSGAIFSLPGKHALRSSSRATALIAAAPPPSCVLSARTSFSPLSLDSSAGEKVYNSIGMMFHRNFHFVSRTEGEIYARFVLTRLYLVGRIPVAASKEAFRRRPENPSEWIKPRWQGTYLSCPMRSTLISLGTSSFFSMFLEAQVRRATVTSSRRWAGVFNEGRAAKKKYQGLAIASRCEAVAHFVTDLEVEEELARQLEKQSLTWWRTTHGIAGKNEWSMTLYWCEQRGVGLRQRCSSASTHVQLEWLTFPFLNFAKNFHLNSWSMPF